jgi:membrane protein
MAKDFKDYWDEAYAFLWRSDPATMPRLQAGFVHMVRIVYVLTRDLLDGQLNLRAMSLVYTTLLSMVPLLAISFSVLKAFGVHNQIEPFLLQLLEPLGEKGIEVTEQVIGFVDNMKVGVLGSIGFVFLIYTVISLILKIERAFNYTWRIERPRPLVQRFSDYLSVILIGPVLMFSAVGIGASVRSNWVVARLTEFETVGVMVSFAGKAVPFLMIILAFTFIYIFIPNTKVRITSALIGGTVAGVLWQIVGWAFASFIVGSAKYTAIYSAFATLVLFMIWLYVGWLILLIGSSIAFYHQNPAYRTAQRRNIRLSSRVKEHLAIQVMVLISRHMYEHERGWTPDLLAEWLRVPAEPVHEVILALEKAGLLAQARDERSGYLPARPLDTTTVSEVLAAVRTAEEEDGIHVDHLPEDKAVAALIAETEGAADRVAGACTLKDLSLSDGGTITPLTQKQA